MNLGVYGQILRRFGVWAVVHGVALAILGKLVKSQLLVVYVLDEKGESTVPEGIEVHRLNAAELEPYVDRPGFELPRVFVEAARKNGDDCIGAFVQGELCGFVWYATQPIDFDNGFTAECRREYAYGYKGLTLPLSRGRSVQKWIQRFAGAHYRQRGKLGTLVAIDSVNFASRRATVGAGARRVGYFAWCRPFGGVRTWSSRGCRAYGFRMYRTVATFVPTANSPSS
jgi:hypothetical protein